MRRATSTLYIMIAALGLASATPQPARAEDPLPHVVIGEPSGPPMVRLGPSPDDCPSAGCLDRELIKRVIKTQSPRMRHCYERALQQDPRAQGRVTARFDIEPDGTVSEATLIRSDIQDTGFQDCVLMSLRRLQFPKRDQSVGKVTITYPFDFKPEP